MSGTEWLSQGAESFLANYLKQGAKQTEAIDVVIVGSGYGGSVAAARLAQHHHNGRPLNVFVFERGKEYVPGDFPRRFADLPGHVRINDEEDPEAKGQRQGLFDVRIGTQVSALVGNGLGGGSLINAGVMAEPTPEVFRQGWPKQLHDKHELAPYYKRVRDMLGARKIPLPTESRSGRYVKPAKLAALEQVGSLLDKTNVDRRAEIAVTFEAGTSQGGVAQQPCIQCGDCFTGCNHWAKNTLAMNYLPYARARGVRLVTGITVLSLQGEDGDWTLNVTLTDKVLADKYVSASESPFLFRNTVPVRAKHVILSAGAYGSTEILLRSKRGVEFSTCLGKRFSTNGDMIAAGFKMRPLVNASPKEGQPPGKRNVGPTITGLIDLRQDTDLSKQIVIEEMAVPAALRRLLEEMVTNLDAFHALTRWNKIRHHQDHVGQDPAGIDSLSLDHTILYAVIGHDESRAQLELVKDDEPSTAPSKVPGSAKSMSDGGIKVTQGCSKLPVGEQPVFELGIERLRQAHANPMLGGTLLPNPLWDPWPEEVVQLFDTTPNKGSVLTVHPLGGCVMADSADTGVVNHIGQVFRGSASAVYETLVVLDGSIVPTSLGINPALTIAAVAERAIEGLKKAWKLDAVRGAIPNLLEALPRVDTQSQPTTARATAFRFSEKLEGKKLRIPVGISRSKVPYERYEFLDASMRLDFAPVPDMEMFLASLPKIMTIDRCDFLLCRDGDEPLPVPVSGYMSVLELENSTPWRRTLRASIAWLLNRGLQEIWNYAAQRLSPSPDTSAAGAPRSRESDSEPDTVSLRQRAKQLFIMASHVGERRRYRYELVVTRDVERNHERYFSAGDRLMGEKIIAYTYRSNPWHQWMDMKLYVMKTGAKGRTYLGEMRVDLPHYVRKHASQLQLTEQDSQPQAIADLISFATYTARAIAKIHLWTFRLPDYPPSLKNSAGTIDIKAFRSQFQRLPGQVRNIAPMRFAPIGHGQYVLHRYTPPTLREDLGPVVLIHGFGASGSSFTLPTVSESMVEHLLQRGFDTWVLDLRTSIALDSSHVDGSFEEVAYDDIAPAIAQISAAAMGQSVNVVAHCIGSAMFCMAALAGKLPKNSIRAAVLSQVGPLVAVTSLNLFRGYVAGYLRYFLNMEEFDVTQPRSDWMDFVDRVLSSYPYPKEEWNFHRSLWPCAKFTHEVFCNRSSTIYNPLFEHRNVNQETLDTFGDLIGHVNLHTYQQTIHFATQERLTDHLGRNVFVTPDNIASHLRFPIFFMHGEHNQLFDVSTSRKSFDLLASVFQGDEQVESDSARTHGVFRFEVIKNYGHQDCIIGDKASRDVFPKISGFLEQASTTEFTVNSKRITLRPPRLGPILCWARTDEVGRRRISVRIVPDDRTSTPRHAITMVCAGKSANNPVPGYCRRHNLVGLEISRQNIPPPRIVEIDLPAGDELTVIVATLHEEFASGSMADQEFLPVELNGALLRSDEDIDHHCADILRLVRKRGVLSDACADARTVDDEYEHTPCSVFLSKEVLRAMDTQARSEAQPLTFAAGSCRYAASAFDRELADRTFGRLRQLIESKDTLRRKPQLLLLLGDQIYADATAGLFDPESPIDRYDNQYLEAWSAPNMRQALRCLPTHMMLDDHEIRENYEFSKLNPVITEALPTFRAYQLLGAPPNPKGRKAALEQPFRHWYEFASGGYGFFVMDTRTERRHALSKPAIIEDSMIDNEQWEYLKEWLEKQDKRRPKFILSPSVVAPWSKASRGSIANAIRADSWDGFPYSLNRLLTFIAQKEIHGVVFISGDYHCSMVCELSVSYNSQPVKVTSIVTSGLYAPYPFANGSRAEFELDFEGQHAQWADPDSRGPTRLAPVCVSYRTRRRSIVDVGSIGLISAIPPRGDGPWLLAVEFDTEAGIIQEEISL